MMILIPNETSVVDISSKQILDGNFPMQNLLSHSPMPSIDSSLSQIEKSPSHHESRKEQPNSRKQTTRKRLKGSVPIPNRCDRHNRQVNRINPIQPFHKVQHQTPNPNTHHHNPKRQTNLQPDPHPSLRHINDVIPSRKTFPFTRTHLQTR